MDPRQWEIRLGALSRRALRRSADPPRELVLEEQVHVRAGGENLGEANALSHR